MEAWFDGALDTIKEDALDPIEDWFDGALDTIKEDAYEPVKEWFDEAIGDITAALEEAYEETTKFFEEDVVNLVTGAYDDTVEFFEEDVAKLIMDAYDETVKFFEEDVANLIVGAYEDTVEFFEEDVANLINGAYKDATKFFEEEVFASIEKYFNAAVGWIDEEVIQRIGALITKTIPSLFAKALAGMMSLFGGGPPKADPEQILTPPVFLDIEQGKTAMIRINHEMNATEDEEEITQLKHQLFVAATAVVQMMGESVTEAQLETGDEEMVYAGYEADVAFVNATGSAAVPPEVFEELEFAYVEVIRKYIDGADDWDASGGLMLGMSGTTILIYLLVFLAIILGAVFLLPLLRGAPIDENPVAAQPQYAAR